MAAHYSSNPLFCFLGVTLASLLVLMATNVNRGNALSFKFSKFDQSPSSKLTLQGTAEILANGVLSLTKHEGDVQLNTGRVVYNKTVSIWDSTGKRATFVTSFCFVVEDIQGTTPADGLALFLSPNLDIPADSTGGELGVISSSASNQVVFVEFDSFFNEEWDPTSLSQHIGINVNSLASSNSVQWNRESGSLVQATISYDGKTLKATLINKNGVITTVEQDVDLKAVLPEKVNVGISATTGGCFETHDIHSWSFISSLESQHTKNTPPTYTCDKKGNN